MLKCRICCTVRQKCIVHTNFCKHFALILNENLTHVVFFHATCWPFYSPNKRTLFWRCQKDASERECIWYPYMRGSENPSKKSVKKLVRASLLSALLSDIRTLGFLYALCGRCKKRPLLSENASDILTHAGPKNLSKQVKKFRNGVPEGSHSCPPGRSKSMVFDRISPGRKTPSDAWPGPPRCSLCLLLVHINHHT